MFETINRLKYKKRQTDNRLLAIQDIRKLLRQITGVVAVIFTVIAVFGFVLVLNKSYQPLGLIMLIVFGITAYILWISMCFFDDYKFIVIKEAEYKEYKSAKEILGRIYYGEVKGLVIDWQMKVYPDEKYDSLLETAEQEKNYY